MAALHGGHLDIAELLYKAGADLNIRNNKNMTLLHAASEGGFVDVAKWLFDHCVPKYSNSQQDNQSNQFQVEAKGFPENVINVDAVDDNGNTPLHLASQDGQSEIVRELLMRGVDVTARDRSRRTPLHLVANHKVSKNCSTLNCAQA